MGVFVSKTNEEVRVAITGAAASVFRWREAEAALLSDFSAGALSGLSLDASGMNNDLHASAKYRAHLCSVITRRAVAGLTG